MIAKEIPGDILTDPSLDCAVCSEQRDKLILLIRDQFRVQPFLGSQSNSSVLRVKAPFYVTKMRDWRGRGRKYAWLWSRRGKDWVIDQEFYLGWERRQMSPQPYEEKERRCA